MNIMDTEDVLRAQLATLREQHRGLDEEIAELSESPLTDQIALRRLKKRKLHLKDEIARIEDTLYPDIIA
ncbi:MAG: YdcH family protein [Pseudomonadota bacterium]